MMEKSRKIKENFKKITILTITGPKFDDFWQISERLNVDFKQLCNAGQVLKKCIIR